jgi:NADPH:quinone reductase-like Zn-dependent oxidoreductase
MTTPSTMRAVRFADHGGPDVLTVDDVPVPDPGSGEVRIRVLSTALNHLDLWVRRGLPIEMSLPHVGGSDLAGVVDALGEGVSTTIGLEGGETPLEKGMRAVVDPSLGWVEPTSDPSTWSANPSGLRLIGEHVDGGFAQYAIVPARNVVPLSPDVDLDLAAAGSLAGVTAWRAVVTRGRARAGETVLVTGASGGVSTLAIQIARARGARVVALTSTPWVERVEALGAEVVLDRHEGEWAKAARAAADRRGIDVVIDSVGGAIWADAIRLLAPGGRFVSYGATGGPKVEIDLRHHFWKQTEFLGSTMGSPADYRAAMAEVVAGRIVPPIHATLPLERCAEAHATLEAGDVFGKLVLHPWREADG